MANRRQPVCQTACLGSDNAERSYQPRLIALPIVPDYSVAGRVLEDPPFKELATTEYPANGSSNQTTNKKSYGQASRLISTSQLNTSLCFHTWPINLVVYQEPLEALRPGTSHLVEGFTLRCLQRLSGPHAATRRRR